MRDYKCETENRVKFIKELVSTAQVSGIVFGNSGGKDAALVGILCKLACDNTLGVSMPCHVSRNYESDIDDAVLFSRQYNIAHKTIDLTSTRNEITHAINSVVPLKNIDKPNIAIAPRLRMITLYTIASNENCLVAGTGNRSERYTGYFTKWGDGAFDFNPIADLTATEVLEFLRYLDAPKSIVEKPPSAGLIEDQTDEAEMGITYAALDNYLLTGNASMHDAEIINRMHEASHHKRKPPVIYQSV